MALTTLDPKTALVIIDLQHGIVAAPTVPYTGLQVVAHATELATALGDITADHFDLGLRGQHPGDAVHGPAPAAAAGRGRVGHRQRLGRRREGTPGTTVYGGSKAALRSFVRTWAAELAGRRIRVDLFSAGVVDLGPDDGVPRALKLT